MNKNFLDIDYLELGSNKQKNILNVLNSLSIFEDLSDYTPVLTGTFPIDIDVHDSDLDIACEVEDFNGFADLCKKLYGKFDEFKTNYSFQNGHQYITVTFEYKGYIFEIYGEDKPVILQNSYKHMVVEDRILSILGPTFKKEVVDLKTRGLKTEPAFGRLLELDKPYEDLLKLYQMPETTLKEYLSERVKALSSVDETDIYDEEYNMNI